MVAAKRPLPFEFQAFSSPMARSEDRSAVDVAIVGGGPAGLSAALILGRCRRRVLLFDSGDPRNNVSHELHGFLTRDCSDPAELRRIGTEQLQRYENVAVRDATVAGARILEDGFEIELATGERLTARKLLLATGVRDALPDIEGFADCYGISAFHCPYCDGWEWRDRALAVHGPADKAPALALELLGWSKDIVLFPDGVQTLSEDDRVVLERNGIRVGESPIRALEGERGRLQRVRLMNGVAIERDALFFAAPAEQKCRIAGSLGCEFDAKGSVKTRAYERTNVWGLYVAGDASRHVELAIVAAAEGAMAAFAINSELLAEDRS
jgi:thioredoxin reductase